MEHSLLHGLQICGIVFALGGVFFRGLVFVPARDNTLTNNASSGDWIECWIARGALAAALAALGDVFVQMAEIDGRTVFTGVGWGTMRQFLMATTVG
jgi:hypothetical protein